MRICADCRQVLDDPRDHDCPAEDIPATPEDDGDEAA